MKKVLAFALAVMMLAVVAFAGPTGDVAPGTTIKINKSKIWDGGAVDVKLKLENGTSIALTGESEGMGAYILRSVSSDNYSVTNVKIQKVGKSLVEGVRMNDAENRVDIILKDDLTNTFKKDFEVSFKLKGKVKFTVRDSGEVKLYNDQVGTTRKLRDNANKIIGVAPEGADPADYSAGTAIQAVGKKASLPDLDFSIVGTVGYGKVNVSVGDDGDEELENLQDLPVFHKVGDDLVPWNNNEDSIDIDNDVVKFVTGASGSAGNVTRASGSRSPRAGSYVADAILTQEYGDALTLEARVYKNDTLYFGIDNSPNRAIIGRLADSDADMDFFLFNSDKNFTTFNSNAILYFNDAEEDDYVYQIRDGKLVKVGNWSDDDGCWVVKTRTLGQYVVSDVELSEFEAAAGETVDGNPDTGANDVVGIATALAAVALVSAAAVSLKK